MSVTRADVAARAGVSTATVSHVINGTKKVTPQVAERVERAVRELGYRPNLVAKSLRTTRSQHVAFLVDNLKNPYYATLLQGAQRFAGLNGYIVSIIMIDQSNEEDIFRLSCRQVDGFIIASRHAEWLTEMAQKEGIPSVSIDDQVFVDYEDGIAEAVKTLKENGHRKIAWLSGLLRETDDPRGRLFRKILLREGLEIYDTLVISTDDPHEQTDEEAGRKAARMLLDTGESFSAIMTVNDLMAVGVLDMLEMQGIRVPSEISLIGCDDIHLARYMKPHLSTIDVPQEKLGEKLMEYLLCKIDSRPFEKTILKTHFIERESTARAVTFNL